eukprot:4144499-Prymnesium_polylepis.1
MATFAQCMFGAATQKYTSLTYTAGLEPHFRPLRQMICTHTPGTHGSVARGVQHDDSSWNSADAAAYPSEFN